LIEVSGDIFCSASAADCLFVFVQKKETPLHLSAFEGYFEAVTELLKWGADSNLKSNVRHFTLLHNVLE
jgi:hypothetical protein